MPPTSGGRRSFWRRSARQADPTGYFAGRLVELLDRQAVAAVRAAECPVEWVSLPDGFAYPALNLTTEDVCAAVGFGWDGDHGDCWLDDDMRAVIEIDAAESPLTETLEAHPDVAVVEHVDREIVVWSSVRPVPADEMAAALLAALVAAQRYGVALWRPVAERTAALAAALEATLAPLGFTRRGAVFARGYDDVVHVVRLDGDYTRADYLHPDPAVPGVVRIDAALVLPAVEAAVRPSTALPLDGAAVAHVLETWPGFYAARLAVTGKLPAVEGLSFADGAEPPVAEVRAVLEREVLPVLEGLTGMAAVVDVLTADDPPALTFTAPHIAPVAALLALTGRRGEAQRLLQEAADRAADREPFSRSLAELAERLGMPPLRLP